MAVRRVLSAAAQAVVAATYAAGAALGRSATAIYQALRAALPGEGGGAIRRELDQLTGQLIETGAIPAAQPQAAVIVPPQTRTQPGQGAAYEYFFHFRASSGPQAGQWLSASTESDTPLTQADLAARLGDLIASGAAGYGALADYELDAEADYDIDVYLLSEA